MDESKNQVVFWCVFVVFLIVFGSVSLGCSSLKSGAVVELPVVSEAKAAAKVDARDAVNMYLWFSISAVALPVSLLGGYAWGDHYLEPDAGIAGLGQLAGLMAGGAVYSTVCLSGVYLFQPSLPPERLIGKSPEYIEAYREAYKEEVRVRRLGSMGFGCLLGCLFMGFIGDSLEIP